MKSFRIFLFILIVGVSLIAFCGHLFSQTAPPASKQKPDPTEVLFEKGEKLYQKQCASCHGLGGAGDGEAAYLLYPKPRDFTRGEFRLVSTTTMEATDEDLFKTISRGMSGSAMPPWEFLPEEDRWSLVYYVRYLSELGKQKKTEAITDDMIQKGLDWEGRKRLMSEEITSDSLIKIGQEPPTTKESLFRGRELFIKGCAPCHGLQGKGDGQQKMQDSSGYPLKPRDLTSGLFKGSSSSKDLYDRMIAGIPGTPMPSYQGAFSEEQIWDLVHYVKTLPKKGAEERARLRRLKISVPRTQKPLSMEPLSPVWNSVKPNSIPLTPLWWRNERIESAQLKVLHDGGQIAFYLSWKDPVQNQTTTAPQLFSDGVALQFSTEKDPPFFGMGDKQSAVFFWHWKSSWQKDLGEWRDIEEQYPNAAVDWYPAQENYQHGAPFEVKDSKTAFHAPEFMSGWGVGNPLSDPTQKSSAEEATAKGLGTLTTQAFKKENKVQAKGVWQDGTWRVVFLRPLNSSDSTDLQFSPGKTLYIAVAVWDGEQQDRDGQKMISIWNELKVE